MIDYTTMAVTYSLLLLPTLFSVAVISQGIVKMKKHESSGKIILTMGIIFLLFIPAAYLLFIKI